MKAIKTALILTLLILIESLFSAEKQPDKEIYKSAVECIENTYKGMYTQAERLAENVIEKERDNPAGYFLKALVLDTRMEAEGRNAFEKEFYRACSRASELGDNSEDVWERFFSAGANGAQGTYESRYQNYVSGFKHGWNGVKVFKEIRQKKPWLKDVNYGIGTYYYFRSAMTEKMWWLPGVKDRRREGINLLKSSANNGLFTKDPSVLMLARIYNDFNKPGSALKYSNRFLKKYPGNLLALWEKGDALIKLKRISDAKKVISRIEKSMYRSPFNTIRLNYLKLKMHKYRGDISKSKAYLKKIKNCKIPDVDKERVKSIIDNAKELF